MVGTEIIPFLLDAGHAADGKFGGDLLLLFCDWFGFNWPSWFRIIAL